MFGELHPSGPLEQIALNCRLLEEQRNLPKLFSVVFIHENLTLPSSFYVVCFLYCMYLLSVP